MWIAAEICAALPFHSMANPVPQLSTTGLYLLDIQTLNYVKLDVPALVLLIAAAFIRLFVIPEIGILGVYHSMYRKATLNDCEKVYDLICDMECKRLPPDKFHSIFQEQMNNGHYYCLVCEYDKAVIGVLNLRFEEQLHHSERIAEIMEFAVDKAYRKQGIGKEMLANACQLAKDFGCIQIEVSCNQLRKDTHRFYLREGMHNYHYKFSKPLIGNDTKENAIGK